jgi:hypothetical protein
LAPFKVFSLFASEDAFTSSSSCVLRGEPLRRKFLATYHRVSKNEEVGLSPRRLPTFLGFVALIAPHGPLVFAQPWLMDSPRSAGYVTAP